MYCATCVRARAMLPWWANGVLMASLLGESGAPHGRGERRRCPSLDPRAVCACKAGLSLGESHLLNP